MKKYLFLLCCFITIVFIIPLSAVSRNGNYFEKNVSPPQSSQISDKPAINLSSSAKEIQDKEESSSEEALDKPERITYKPTYSCDYFEIYDLSEDKTFKVSARDYVIGAVASEMPPNFEDEAIKAQAVACHTLAIRNRIDHMKNPQSELKGGDFSADPNDKKGYVTKEKLKEMYGDKFDLYYNKIADLCDSVMDKVIIYEENPIISVYHSTSCGKTEAAENVWLHSEDYLKAVPSDGDLLSAGYESKNTFSQVEMKNILTKNYSNAKLGENPLEWFKITERSQSGYVLTIDVGNISLTGKDIRELLGLRSTNFNIAFENGNFTFTVYGYGHGVGLSQYGADYMARQGANYEEILKHYYSGIVIADLK